MKALAKAVGELPDADWNKLTKAAQDWYNSAVDAAEAKKDLPVFPDMAKAEEALARRRGAAKTEEDEGPYTPKVGDTVRAVTKRGKEVIGKIAEIDGTTLVIATEDGDEELDTDRLQSIAKVGGSSTKAAAKEEEPEVQEPEVLDTVTVTTKRGKVATGNITEIDDEVVVIKTAAGDVEEFDKSRVESIVVKVKNAGKGKGEATKAVKDAGKAADEADKPKRTSSKDNGGVSVTVRMREHICDNLSWTKDQVSAAMKKEALEFKPATLDLVFAEAHKLISMLRERKVIKG
jgi:small nuclear ribonucleoprotein (snRNP)-like protein